MRLLRSTTCAVVLFAGVSTAHADLRSSFLSDSPSNPASRALATDSTHRHGTILPADFADDASQLIGLRDATVGTDAPTAIQEYAKSEIRELPPTPSSDSLFLCALGSIGVWQLGRSFRKLEFASVPSWLHTGGPDQIGRSVAVDLEINLAPVLVAIPLDSSEANRPAYRHSRHEAPFRLPFQTSLTLRVPRGPPALS